ncbi:hypothetical protein RISK_002386 [Rhodopirellula islandica]|uniref:Uncharacterized protein n=1 Tax=Rhodopirellula islandica TaxID=595434 RepID=A0A0J1EJR7_RHOIS|nr:hypothetical protein [Rhodopirellula islandica]KLU05754.1 hypothetical protein RISK_002386 [Rhodopirellula islandica]
MTSTVMVLAGCDWWERLPTPSTVETQWLGNGGRRFLLAEMWPGSTGPTQWQAMPAIRRDT